MMCPACARGAHDRHLPISPGPVWPVNVVQHCTCTGDCTTPVREALDRLVAAGVIAPPSVRRGD